LQDIIGHEEVSFVEIKREYISHGFLKTGNIVLLKTTCFQTSLEENNVEM
jgi:hypothetical protein